MKLVLSLQNPDSSAVRRLNSTHGMWNSEPQREKLLQVFISAVQCVFLERRYFCTLCIIIATVSLPVVAGVFFSLQESVNASETLASLLAPAGRDRLQKGG